MGSGPCRLASDDICNTAPEPLSGRTFSAETRWLEGDEPCPSVHEIVIEGQRSFESPFDSAGLTAGARYKGEFEVIDEGPAPGKFVSPANAGSARFTTGSTTVRFTRARPCV